MCKSALKTKHDAVFVFREGITFPPDNKHRAESVYATETKAELAVQAASLLLSWQSRQEVCTLGLFSQTVLNAPLMCDEPVIF